MRKVVVNTTPLIALAEIGELHLLKDLYSEIYIPHMSALSSPLWINSSRTASMSILKYR